MTPTTLLVLYCVLILLASLAGGWLPLWVRLTHTRMQLATSFVAGLMLGVGMLHLLPHAFHETASIDLCAFWLLAGFLAMFLIQRFFHYHHHDVPAEAPEDHAGCCPAECREQAILQPRDHEHLTLADQSARHLSWIGAALGLTFHTLINGIALGASVEAEAHGGAGVLLGLGTFLVIFLHKPFDALAIGTLMAAGGWSRTSRHWVNAAFALVIPLGVVLFHLGASRYTEMGQVYLGGALAFAAGTFVCIAASDLLPELQFHAHDRFKLTMALAGGLIFAVIIGQFETAGHDHHQAPEQGAMESPIHDHDHDHDH
jgi:zinc and cadmium transporter